MIGVLITATSVVAISFTEAANALTAPIVTWKKSSLLPSTSYATSALASSNSSGTKVWSVSGSCIFKNRKITTSASGSCTLKLVINAKGKFMRKSFSKRIPIVKKAVSTTTSTTLQMRTPVSSSFPQTTTIPTTTPVTNFYPTTTLASGSSFGRGLASTPVNDIFAIGLTVYAATGPSSSGAQYWDGGLSISTDGGATFTTRTTANGLGSNYLTGVFAVGSTVYVSTGPMQDQNTDVRYTGGLSISTDGGATFTNRTTANGLGSNDVLSVYVAGSKVYAATANGLSISTDGGVTFTNRTRTNGLGSNWIYRIYAEGSLVYVATGDVDYAGLNFGSGLSISTDGGATFTTRTTANGLRTNAVYNVYAIGTTVYAATGGGVSISTNGGTTFTTRTRLNGLPSNLIREIYATDSKVYAATDYGLSISNDGGTTFTTSGPVYSSGSDILAMHVSGSRVYTGTFGGIGVYLNS